VPTGILVTAGTAIILAVGFDLSSIASIGSAIALCVFTMITAAHMRVRHETGARMAMLVLGVLSTVTVLVTFVFTTLVEEPATAVTLAVILLLCVIIDLAWKRTRDRRMVAFRSPDVSDDVGASGLS
jgi:L-asparagine transporter-like permease